MAQMASANPSILYLANPDGPKVEWDSRLVNEVQPPHIEISSFEVDPVRRLRGVKQLDPAVQGEIDADSRFLDGLDKNYDPEATFGSRIPLPEDLEYVDPTVYVWKKKSSR
jgi:hypothetical protein